MIRIAAAFPPCCSSAASCFSVCQGKETREHLAVTEHVNFRYSIRIPTRGECSYSRSFLMSLRMVLTLSPIECQPAVKYFLQRCEVSVLQTSTHHVCTDKKYIHILNEVLLLTKGC